MEKASIEYPDEVRLSLNVSREEFTHEIRMAAAVKLYELGRLCSGRAAELAGVSRIRFLHELSRFGVSPFAASESELLHDADAARPR